SLNNIALTAPYMHDGSLATLEAVVAFYARGGIRNPNIDEVMVRRRLSVQERADLVAFLRALTTDWLADSSAVTERLDRLGRVTTIAGDSSGGFYVVDSKDGVLKAFDRTGSFIRAIGRRGAGPGEYEMIRNLMVAPDGSLHVLDGVLGRHTVFRRDGKLVSIK